MATKNLSLWLIWLIATAALAGWLVLTLMDEGEADKTMFLPGKTSAGHHQIEQVCTACHSESFADKDAVQAACEGCHAVALKAAKDDHPKSKFTDPRNADRIEVLDARYCVACHVEHRPEITLEMGVTVPADTCYLCHAQIAEDRPSHEGMAFDTCTSAGCHNFHDNRALYEDFLLKHMDEPDTAFESQLLVSNLREIAQQLPDYPLDDFPLEPVGLESQDIPSHIDVQGHIFDEWLASSHAAAGVGCNGCHVAKQSAPGEAPLTGAWIERPGHDTCAGCHAGEVAGFLQGKHGMRLDVDKLGRNLSPMTPAMAQLPMKADAANRELTCQSCHSAHRYDSASAPVDSCLGCHDDQHSLAYIGSPHHDLWLRERAGEAEPGSGVTCASCHMPRIEKDYYWGTFVHNEVQHNQSDTLRPNEKMLRPICMECHGLGFSIDALADENLIRTNFASPPAIHIQSIDLARERAGIGM
jgi:formate-dependent nitrite reductase cytochrome c552 subunit